VVVGGPEESSLARTIQRKAQARDLTGRTDFAQIAALGARATLAVGNDTGPTHLIAAAGAPSLVLFSKNSNPDLCAPRGHVTVLRADNLASLSVDEVARACTHLSPMAAVVR
jgi:ADP-heptose:LPS heptosyltransferase